MMFWVVLRVAESRLWKLTLGSVWSPIHARSKLRLLALVQSRTDDPEQADCGGYGTGLDYFAS